MRSRTGSTGKPFGSAIDFSTVAALALAFAFVPGWVGNSLVDLQRTHRALIYQAHLRSGIGAAVDKAGGRARVLACGSVMTEGFQVPMLAWTLGVHTITPPDVTHPGSRSSRSGLRKSKSGR